MAVPGKGGLAVVARRLPDTWLFWVKGSIKGMIEGKVSRRWAKKHHPRWYREIEKAEAKKESEEGIQ